VVPANKAKPGRKHGICDIVYCLTVADEVFDGPLCHADTGYPDVVVVPDQSTLRPVPWEPSTAAVLADVMTKAGDPYPLCPRDAVRRAERRLAAVGFEARMAVEFEFFLLSGSPEDLRLGRYGNLTPASHDPQAYSLRRWPGISAFAEELQEAMELYGAPLETIHSELGLGAFEVALQPAPPLQAADRAARFKLGCKAIAARHGLVATFMAKWNAGEAGSSGHIHQSVWRGEEAAFWDPARAGLSELGEGYLEGLLSSVGDLSVVFGPNANSYRRPDPAMWAPTTASWGVDNRSACLRVCGDGPESIRIEHRRPGADVSVYYAIAACVAAGAAGIEQQLQLRPEAPRDASKAENAEQLPATLRDAVEQFRGSSRARDLLGDIVVEHYAISRDEELSHVEALAKAVPEWELQRYLETV
jgi:glutamine synthetase